MGAAGVDGNQLSLGSELNSQRHTAFHSVGDSSESEKASAIANEVRLRDSPSSLHHDAGRCSNFGKRNLADISAGNCATANDSHRGHRRRILIESPDDIWLIAESTATVENRPHLFRNARGYSPYTEVCRRTAR